MNENVTSPSSLGMEPKLAALLAYIPIVGIIFFFVEKQNKFVKYHAAQSLVMTCAYFAWWIVSLILGFIPIINIIVAILGFLVGIAYFVISIICMMKAWKYEWYRVPLAGEYAMKLASK